MTESTATSRPRGTGPILLFFVFLTFAAIIGQTWLSIIEDRTLTLATEHENALVAVRLLEEHATQTMRDAERNLDSVARTIAAVGREVDEPMLSKIISEGQRDNRFLRALQYTNPAGKSLVSSIDYPAFQTDADDRKYIGYLLAHPDHKPPVVGRAFQRFYDQELVVPLARTIHDKDGRFLGLISTDISVSYFRNVYSRVASGGKAVVALFADDGFVIVRSPYDARFLSMDLSGSPVLELLRARGGEGLFEDDRFLGDIEPTPRQYSYRKVHGFPVTTVYARDIDSILVSWRARTYDRILYAGVFIAIHLVLTYFLAVHIARLHVSEASLRDNIERLNLSDQSLRASESKFVNMFQYSPVPLSVIRMKDDRILEVNDSLLRQFGYTRDEFIGQTPLTLRMWADPDARAPYVELLSAEKFIDRHELHLLDKQGRDMFCQLSARVFDADGEPMAIFSPIDVTRQRAIEREIRELNTALEERVRQRTATLEQNNVELAGALEKLREAQSELLRTEKMAALGSLVAGVAHELNTPIGNSVTVASTVHEAAQRLTAELTQPTPRRSALQSAAAACLKGAELLGRTLQRAAELVVSFKQVAVDQSSNHRRRFDLRQAIEEVLLTVEPMYMKTSFRVEHELAPSIIMDSYPGALGQIITNFISNALHHGFEGRDIGHMRIITRADATTVELDFIDDGVGIPAQFIERVFDPFFTTKLGQGGSGLGMHIVYNVVTDILGGKVQLESTVGVGTRIHVSMPLIAPYRAEDAVLAA